MTKQNTLFIRIFLFCLICSVITATPVICQNRKPDGEGVESKPTIDERIKQYFNQHGMVRFGINTDFVFTTEYDTGFGFGMRLPKKVFVPLVEMTTSLNFWGASNDTLDASYFGLEESLTIHKYPSDKIEIFSGVSAGYYGKVTTRQKLQGKSFNKKESQKNSFSAYVTVGLVHKMNSERSVFVQLKHWLIEESKEIHINGGIYFH